MKKKKKCQVKVATATAVIVPQARLSHTPGTNMAKSVDLIGCGTLVKPTINRFKQLLLL